MKVQGSFMLDRAFNEAETRLYENHRLRVTQLHYRLEVSEQRNNGIAEQG
jgi:hypothetical protein